MMLKIFALIAVVMCISLGTDATLPELKCTCKNKYGYWNKYGAGFVGGRPNRWNYYGNGALNDDDYSSPWNSNGNAWNSYGDDVGFVGGQPNSWNSYGDDAGFVGGQPNSWSGLGNDGWSYAVPRFNLRLPGLDGEYGYNVGHNVRHDVRHRIRHVYRQTGLSNYRPTSLRLRGLSGTRNYRVGHNVGHTVKHDIRHKFRTVNPYLKGKSVCVCRAH